MPAAVKTGAGAESASLGKTGHGAAPCPSNKSTFVCGEPGTKPFIEGLLLDQGFVGSREVFLLQSIMENERPTQGFISSKSFIKKEKILN